MGLTQKLGTIPLAIQTDSSNNVGIGGAANASYKLAVTGASNFTGVLRTESTINMTGTSAQLLQTTANSIAGDNVAVLYNSNANSYGLYIGAGSGTNHALYITDSTRSKNLFKVEGNGSIGIGTGNPVSLGASYTTLEIKGQTGLYGGAIQLTSADGTNKGRVYVANDTFWVGTQNSLPLGFITADTERMRITSGGDVLIGTTTGTKLSGGVSMLQVSGAGGGGQINISGGYTPDAALNIRDFSNNYISFFYGNTKTGSVTTNGSTTAYNTTSSDRELKKNFEDWNENVLEIFKNSNPQLFNFKTEDDDAVKTKGFIAQELYNYFPEAYPIGQDEKHLFNPSGMVIYLMKALKDAAVKIDELSAKVTALENK